MAHAGLRERERVTAAGLTTNPERCLFFRNEIHYLGYLMNSEGVKLDPEKLAPVAEYPAPKKITQNRRFLGSASGYRRFTPNLATISKPLTRLLRKKCPCALHEEQEAAFQAIKKVLSSAPVVSCPNFAHPFTVQTDASSTGFGAVIKQTYDCTTRVIA